MIEVDSVNLPADSWDFRSKYGYKSSSVTSIVGNTTKIITTFEDGASVTLTMQNGSNNASVVINGIAIVDSEKKIVYLSRK